MTTSVQVRGLLFSYDLFFLFLPKYIPSRQLHPLLSIYPIQPVLPFQDNDAEYNTCKEVFCSTNTAGWLAVLVNNNNKNSELFWAHLASRHTPHVRLTPTRLQRPMVQLGMTYNLDQPHAEAKPGKLKVKYCTSLPYPPNPFLCSSVSVRPHTGDVMCGTTCRSILIPHSKYGMQLCVCTLYTVYALSTVLFFFSLLSRYRKQIWVK